MTISEKEIYQAKGGPISGLIRAINKIEEEKKEGGGAIAIFVSDVQEGNGTAANIPHGFDTKPSSILVVPITVPEDTPYDFSNASAGTTNVIVTAPAGVKYKVLAIE